MAQQDMRVTGTISTSTSVPPERNTCAASRVRAGSVTRSAVPCSSSADIDGQARHELTSPGSTRYWDGLWVGADPTNAIQPGNRHVEVAQGRQYGDAPAAGHLHRLWHLADVRGGRADRMA